MAKKIINILNIIIPQVKKIKTKMVQTKNLLLKKRTIKKSKNWIWDFSKENDTKVKKTDNILIIMFKRWRKSKWNDSNRKTSLRVKSYEEVFEIIQTHEILSESDCSEIDENKG